MALFTSTSFDSFESLFIDQLQDIYDAEQRLAKVLPELAEVADDARLKMALREHLTETERQLKSLEELFSEVDQKPKAKTCDAMKGLISEARQLAEAQGEASVRDAAILAAAQRIDHYEIAAYGTARTFAKRLGHETVASGLQRCLDEEKAADFRLTELAEQVINPMARAAAQS